MVSQPDSLEAQLRRDIQTGGPIPLADFMGRALSAYYAGRDPLGAEGDFITAPEISQMFGEMIGLWMAVVWQSMGCPTPVVLAELGPGRGTLMADVLRAAAMVPPFLQAIQVCLVETSPVLRNCQRRILAGYDVRWVQQVEDIPPGPILLVANEFFDALPVEQFQAHGGAWFRRMVGLGADGQFAFVDGDTVDLSFDDPDGTIREFCFEGQRIAAHLGHRIARQGGAMLVVDYGYGTSQAGDSLQAVKGHEFHPVLADPGLADLTTHVDFQALAEAAIPARAYGVIGQGAFLKALGIETRLGLLVEGKPTEVADSLASGMRRLIDKDAMGVLFKVMALAHPAYPPPPGFV